MEKFANEHLDEDNKENHTSRKTGIYYGFKNLSNKTPKIQENNVLILIGNKSPECNVFGLNEILSFL